MILKRKKITFILLKVAFLFHIYEYILQKIQIVNLSC